MRKAGSTSIMNFLNAYKNRRAALGAPTVWVFQEEYHALNARCLLTDGAIPGEGARARRRLQKAWKLPLSMPSKLAAANVFRVTHLREPIARHNSEFWFAGPGKDNKKADAASWREWMAATNSHVQSFSFIAFREPVFRQLLRAHAERGGLRALRSHAVRGQRQVQPNVAAAARFLPSVRGQIRARAGRHKMDAGNSAPVDTLGGRPRAAGGARRSEESARGGISPCLIRARARPSDSTRC